MCGIVGFTGEHQAAPILLDGLSKLEYRGYDSAGIAVIHLGPLTESRLPLMLIRMPATMKMLLLFITVLSKIIRSLGKS